jgi:hypothetical protein
MGKWRYSFTILDLGTRCRRVVSFTPRPLFPRAKSPQYHLDRVLGGPQSRSGRRGIDTNILPLPGIEPRPSSPYPVAIPTELMNLHTMPNFSCLTRPLKYQWSLLCNCFSTCVPLHSTSTSISRHITAIHEAWWHFVQPCLVVLSTWVLFLCYTAALINNILT